ncbi:MAG: chemotaxis protein CheA [Lachnospiraceae bacterium]|nr:chemotaxis protein CheA [Lachnospiraceae bacterium]
MDVSQYLGIFLDETNEHLQTLSDQLMILENEPENEDTINEIFRAAHSLKGMAGTMGYKRMQNLTHDMENVFSEVRNGKIKVDGHMVDILFQALDALEEYRENISQNQDEGTNDNEPIIQALQAILNGDSAAPEAKASDAPAQGNAEASEKPAQEAGAASSEGGKWHDIVLHEPEQHVISEAIKNNSKVYGFTVYIQETCILKAARAFLVFKALEELGEVIVSEPSVQDIEDEKFDFDFSLYFVTDSPIDKVKEAILSVSEIDRVEGDAIDMDKAKIAKEDDDEEESAPSAEAQPSSGSAPAPAPSAGTPAPAQQPAADHKGADNKKTGANKPAVNRTVRVDIEKLDVLMNLVSELIIAKNSLVSFATSESSSSHTGFNEQIEYLESVTTNLHESVMKVRMVPIESVVNKFPRMIRDLSKKLDKQMELHMSGEETELDRTVVDEIGDPLMHLLRNSADHGLEHIDLRRERGKSDVGQIYLDAYQDGNNVVIEVRDDGNGIDTEAVKRKAIERGTITPEQGETMSEKEIIDLLFLPSFSTAKVVSDVSGRGVGLDVVRSKIGSLGGDVSVKTKLGEGSTWTIRLPLTLAIIQALMVVIGDEKYAVSLGSIQTIEDVAEEDIKYVEAREVINLRDTVIPIIRLRDVLGVKTDKEQGQNLVVIIVKKGDQLAGLVVDELIGQQEIVIKSLGKYINCSSRLISGATILGDGEVALILDANVLI